ncbi:MAG: hypothetical protein ACK4FZ_01270 [Vogesella sp.]|uniref:hypothetical protein n=1 Tax=Vogesella sp. TaxID=1904252 RepID=UPI00391C490E
MVYFSGLTSAGFGEPYKKSSLNDKTLAFRVHSASLREYKVGTIWLDGKRIAGPPVVETPFRVDVSQVRLVMLDESVDLNGQLVPTVLPERYLCFGKDNRAQLASTLYAIVPVLGDRMTKWLVVPSSELLRFYIGVSSRLLSGALQGRLENYVDWGKSRMENGTPVLHVKQRLNRKEAATLARAVASPTAKAVLLGGHQHLATIQANNAPLSESSKRPLTIKANFPFTDTTLLAVSGKRMPLTNTGDKDQWAVFAMELRGCSHSFGFSGVELESDDPFDGRGQADGTGSGKPPHYNPLLDDDEEDDYDLEDQPADQRLPRLVVLNRTNQFSAFDDLEFKQRRPKVDRPASLPGSTIDVLVDAFTMEDGSHAEDTLGTQGVSEFQSRVEQVDRELTLFLEMLRYLRVATAAEYWMIATRKLGDGLVVGGEAIALFPEKVGKRRTWHKITDPDGNVRPRQVVWVEVVPGSEGQFFYLLEMELKPGEMNGQCTILLHTNDFSRLDDQTFQELLVLTAVQNRWPDRHNKWKEDNHFKRAKELFAAIEIHRINHPRVPRPKEGEKTGSQKPRLNPKSWSDVLLTRIEELLPFLEVSTV